MGKSGGKTDNVWFRRSSRIHSLQLIVHAGSLIGRDYRETALKNSLQQRRSVYVLVSRGRWLAVDVLDVARLCESDRMIRIGNAFHPECGVGDDISISTIRFHLRDNMFIAEKTGNTFVVVAQIFLEALKNSGQSGLFRSLRPRAERRPKKCNDQNNRR